MKLMKADDNSLKKAAGILDKGGVIIYPTDTLYGLGADAANERAKKRIYEIKGRDFDKPLSICVSSLSQAEKFAKVDGTAWLLAEKFLPGPLTLVLEQQKELKYISKDGKIAVRIPENIFAIRLAEMRGRAFTSTSANLSGGKNPVSVGDIPDEVKDKCDLVVDGGISKFMKTSTVLDVSERKIIREGAITREELKEFLG